MARTSKNKTTKKVKEKKITDVASEEKLIDIKPIELTDVEISFDNGEVKPDPVEEVVSETKEEPKKENKPKNNNGVIGLTQGLGYYWNGMSMD